MQKLTPKFNVATVNKGDTFEIDLFSGGFMGQRWNMEVVSGKATLLSETSPGNAGVYGTVFRAEEAGDIEIVAESWSAVSKQPMGKCTFKLHVS